LKEKNRGMGVGGQGLVKRKMKTRSSVLSNP
jgi:hypothetical protein